MKAGFKTQEKGDEDMFTGAELIVGLWLVPVTLFIIIPLVILLTWGIARLLKPLVSIKKAQKTEERVLETAGLSASQSQ